MWIYIHILIPGEIKCKLDANVRTTDLHRDGDIFCELFTQKITKEWIDEYQSGWSVKSHDCYVVNFVNYSNLSTYQADDFGFSYPSYYDQYVDFTPKTEEDRGEQYLRICADVKMLSPVEYGGKKVSVFDIAETAYEPRDYMTDYEYSDFPTLEMSEVKLLWNNEEKCIQYTMAGDETAVLYEVASENRNLKKFSVYMMMVSDSEEVCYHFKTNLEGTTYPVEAGE